MTKIKTLLLGALMTTALVLPRAAEATPISLVACANGDCADLSGFIVNQNGPISTVDTTTSIGGALVSVSALIDFDPLVSFTFGSVLPTGFGPITFDVFFTTPVAPGFYNTASSTATATVTGGPATASTGTYPAFISGIGMLGVSQTNLGVDLGTSTCSAGISPCGYGLATNTFAPTLFDSLTAHLSYTHTGAGSVGWTGAVTLDQVSEVPEPTSMLLLGGGLLGGAWRRRGRSTAARTR